MINHTTAAGAHNLAESIRKFWREHGFDVETRIERIVGDAKFELWVVCSDMINGMPQRKIADRPPAAAGRKAASLDRNLKQNPNLNRGFYFYG